MSSTVFIEYSCETACFGVNYVVDEEMRLLSILTTLCVGCVTKFN